MHVGNSVDLGLDTHLSVTHYRMHAPLLLVFSIGAKREKNAAGCLALSKSAPSPSHPFLHHLRFLRKPGFFQFPEFGRQEWVSVVVACVSCILELLFSVAADYNQLKMSRAEQKQLLMINKFIVLQFKKLGTPPPRNGPCGKQNNGREVIKNSNYNVP